MRKQSLKSNSILTPSGIKSGYLNIENDLIFDISDMAFCEDVLDYSGYDLLPGLVDTHVHVNEPGRTAWEGFISATKAAAAGGITTLVDMPLNCTPVTVSKNALEEKLSILDGKLYNDVGFWGGVIPQSLTDLDELLKAGVLGVKSFLIDSGISDFPPMAETHLRQAMEILQKYQVPYLIHAELEEDEQLQVDTSYQSFLDSRPMQMEDRAIELMINLLKEIKTPVHIVHLSSARSLKEIKAAKDLSLPLSVETCPHYLTILAENILDGQTQFKCCPPIREKDNAEKLWAGIKDGIIDMIVSDHSPCTANLKKLEEGDFSQAWGGISSLQIGLGLIWTEAQARGIDLRKIVELMATNTAAFAGLSQKGKLEKGKDADIVVFDRKAQWQVKASELFHKNKITPYEGRHINGQVLATYLRGDKIYEKGQLVTGPLGKTILRNK